MYVENYTKPKSTRSLKYDKKTLALVVKDNTETKKDNVIGVYIPRFMFGLPIDKGAYEKDISFDSSKLINSKNKNIGKTSLTVKNYVEIPIAVIPNQKPSRFRKGENVFVDLADNDIKSLYVLPYSLGEENRRKTDIISFLCPNLKNELDDITVENSYGIQLDTINQILSLWTTKVNDEKSAYMFSINAKEGKILLSDDGKRNILIDTKEDSISLENEEKSKIEMIKDTINIKCKTLNIDVEKDINVTSDELNRKIKKIKTEATSDEEKIDKLEYKGNKLNVNYNTQKIESSSYENKTSKWKVDSPISGFTKILTADSFHIWAMAGINPIPTCANISNAGIASMGNPSIIALPLAKAQPTTICLSAISAVVDTIGCVLGIPPTLVAMVSSMTPVIQSNNSKG